MNAVYDEILTCLKAEGILPHHHEGEAESGWLLLDYGAVVVHIFALAEREYYQLDRLWQQASPVVRIQ
jgi:ribosome-associated protein